jgi:hypothetical protein
MVQWNMGKSYSIFVPCGKREKISFVIKDPVGLAMKSKCVHTFPRKKLIS